MSQMSSNFKYISMNQKCRHLVFLKILSAVTPECVVDRLRRFNVYIWLLKPIYSQHECQFMQNTFGNTGQRMDSIRISGSILKFLWINMKEYCYMNTSWYQVEKFAYFGNNVKIIWILLKLFEYCCDYGNNVKIMGILLELWEYC